MARSRQIKPPFFKHLDLYEAEVESGLPLRIAFAGLWGVTDRAGRFPWKRDIKMDVIPYDPVSMLDVLDALERYGFVQSYVVGGKKFGLIPTFGEHQSFHHTERESTLPPPPLSLMANGEPPEDNGDAPVTNHSVAVAVAVPVAATVPVAGAVAVRERDGGDISVGVQLLRFIAEHNFGAFAPSVVGLIRSARSPEAIMATLRMHIQGEMGHELATALEVGLACQHFLAQEEPFSARYFAGFVRSAKRGAERVENRKHAAAETAAIAAEDSQREREREEDARVNGQIAAYRAAHAEDYARLEASAEKLVPTTVTGIFRAPLVRAELARMIQSGGGA